MKCVVLGVFATIGSLHAIAQTNDVWNRVVQNEVSTASQINKGIYLIEGSIKEIRSADPFIEVVRSLDAKHHVIKITSDTNFSNRIWHLDDRWKMDVRNPESQKFLVVIEGDAASILRPFKILDRFPSSDTYLIEATVTQIWDHLLSKDEVLHVTDKIARPAIESRVIDLNLNPNRVNKIHHFYPDLDGSSEIVSIQENRFRSDDIDLVNRSRTTGLESDFVDNHATEMATIIAGAGNSFVTGKGVARSAILTSSDFAEAMPDSDESFESLGIHVQNHSYGIMRSSEYGVQARAFDISAASNRDLLHVFSSGNEGLEVSSEGRYAGIEGYANLTGNLKMSKNSLVVGSVDTLGNIPSFVSRGPAYDGRVKPEVVAYSVVGSSNSAALVSGVSLLLQQQYQIQNQGQAMPSSLLKALLVNGAEDVGPVGPDFLTGFGNVNAWLSLQMILNNQYISGSLSNNDINTHIISLPENAKNLKVTIAWTDPAANVGDYKALVNDLDLRLNDGSIETLPWVLDSQPSTSSLASEAFRGVDTLNNIEQVTISDPNSTYTIEVEGSSMVSDQEYFIAWHYEIEDSFEWDFPTGSDNMPYDGETGSYFRWSTTLEGVGDLSYTVDGVNWIELANDVNLAQGYWRWSTPPVLNDAVQARMIVGENVYETDTFTVSVPLKASIGFNCADSLMIKWQRSEEAVNYVLYNQGVERLEALSNTSDTFLIISQASMLNDTRISVQPILKDGKQLLQSPTFDFNQQGVECFAISFFQTVALDTGIYLNLSLGTTYGIASIDFERFDFNDFTLLTSLQDVTSEQVSFLDDDPIQGYNEHRAVIHFVNGESLAISSGSLFYLTESPLTIFPNPVQSGDFLTIITKAFEDKAPLLEVFDQYGALIHKQQVLGSQDVIPTGGMKSGIYYYRMRADGREFSGRFLVR